MARLNLVHLETICWIARLGTFTAAADRLNTTQPAISGRVRELESALQFNVFDRTGRSVTLTPQGRMLVEQIEPLVRNIERVATTLMDPSAETGRVRIGAGHISREWLAQMISDLQAKMPQVFYDIEVDLASNLTRKVAQGHLDLAVIAGTTGESHLLTEELGQTPLNWYASPTFLDSLDVDPLDFQRLFHTVPLWTVPRNSQFFPIAMMALEQYDVDQRRISSSHDMNVTIALVREGAGAGFLPEVLIADDLRSGKLVKIDTDVQDVLVSIYLIMHPDRISPLLQSIAAGAATFSHKVLIPGEKILEGIAKTSEDNT
jgi:DNA-binding transcriptional LysR family regulator